MVSRKENDSMKMISSKEKDMFCRKQDSSNKCDNLKLTKNSMTTIILIAMLALFVFVGAEKIVYAQTEDCKVMVYSMIEAIQNKNWDVYMNLMDYDQQDFYCNYFQNEKCVDGIKQINNVEIEDIISISSQEILNELLYSEYPIFNSTEEIVPFLVSLNCDVSKENAYFYNGVNYFLVVFVKENDGTYKVAQFNRPSYELLNKVISKQKIQ